MLGQWKRKWKLLFRVWGSGSIGFRSDFRLWLDLVEGMGGFSLRGNYLRNAQSRGFKYAYDTYF